MRRAGLMTRLAKLERQTKVRGIPKLVFTLGEDAGEVTGYRLGNVTILRLAGETADECQRRAFDLQPHAASAAALYGPEECGQHPSDALSGPFPADFATTQPQRG